MLGFSHLLKRVDFDAVVDHLPLTHIMRSTSEPVINRIKRLLEILNLYTFNLYYLKGKDMVLSDYLSRMEGDKSDPHKVIPISFNSHSTLTGHYYTYYKLPSEMYGVVTRSETKVLRTHMQKVHEIDKVIDQALKPKTQTRREGILKAIPLVCKSVS